jgi:hypothetical protein
MKSSYESSDESDIFESQGYDLLLLVVVCKLNLLEDSLLARLLQLPCHDELVEDEVGLLKVEDDVELAHGAKVLVKHLHVAVDRLQDEKLVLLKEMG